MPSLYPFHDIFRRRHQELDRLADCHFEMRMNSFKIHGFTLMSKSHDADDVAWEWKASCVGTDYVGGFETYISSKDMWSQTGDFRSRVFNSGLPVSNLRLPGIWWSCLPKSKLREAQSWLKPSSRVVRRTGPLNVEYCCRNRGLLSCWLNKHVRTTNPHAAQITLHAITPQFGSQQQPNVDEFQGTFKMRALGLSVCKVVLQPSIHLQS